MRSQISVLTVRIHSRHPHGQFHKRADPYKIKGRIDTLTGRHEKRKRHLSISHVIQCTLQQCPHTPLMTVIRISCHCHDIIAGKLIPVYNHGIRIQVQHGNDLLLFLQNQNRIISYFVLIIIVHKPFRILYEHRMIQFPCKSPLFRLQIPWIPDLFFLFYYLWHPMQPPQPAVLSSSIYAAIGIKEQIA